MANFSVLTNSGAASAILMLNRTMQAQNQVQQHMNTGLRINSAKDDSSTFSIAMGMRSDVAGFKKVRENLATGSSTVAIASSAADEIGKQISTIKEKVTQAKGNATGRDSIQLAIKNAIDQIKNVTAAAQLNGVNLIDGSKNGQSYQVTSSLNRTADGTLSLGTIDVSYQDLAVSATGGLQALNGLDVSAGGLVKGADTAKVAASTTVGVDTAKTTNTSTYSTVRFTVGAVGDLDNGATFTFDAGAGAVNVALNAADVTAIGGSFDNFAKVFNAKANALAAGVEMKQTAPGSGTFVLQSVAGGTDKNVTTSGATFLNSAAGTDIASASTVVNYKAGGEAAGYTEIDLGSNPSFKAGDSLQFRLSSAAADATYTFDGSETSGNLLSKLTSWASANNHNVKFEYVADSNKLKITANRADEAVAASGAAGRGFDIAAAAGKSTVDFGGASAPTLTEGDTISVQVNGKAKTYTVGADDVASGMNGAFLTKVGAHLGVTASLSGGKLTLTGATTADAVSGMTANVASVKTGEADFDGLLKNIDKAETHLKGVVGALGSSEDRLSSQTSFMDSLIKSVNDGIGTMVDADMAEESARFQALQVQQQLGVQALSIANSAPQAILSLFR